MDGSQYQRILLKVLGEHSVAAKQKIAGLIRKLPAKAVQIEFGIFPDQDGEGTFSVVISLDGPDNYVLNKAIEEFRTIFDVLHTPAGFVPDLPMFDPDKSEFDVNDVIVDSAAIWIKDLWDDTALGVSPIPGLIFGDEGYGTTTPISLAN